MKLSLIIFVSFFVFACGIKGPPLPPIEETTIQKQKATEAVNSTQAPLSSSDSTKAKTK
ncbi:MAG: hypothetical protein ABL930_03600 [Pseudobdellovibrio sp.]